MYEYIGHPHQIAGVEEVTLSHGKGKGMTLLNIRNGRGLEITLLPDRCLDIARVTFKGDNMGYFSPCGYVAPAYYDKDGAGFLKSFTAGFMTTCGIDAVGSPCTDEGEVLPLHGRIGNTPCESYRYTEDEEEITAVGVVRDATLFGRAYLLTRTYRISKCDNTFCVSDTVCNISNAIAPCMLLYHINLGYPLLSEEAKVFVPSTRVTPRNAHAGDHIDTCLQMEKPQADYEECCYYHDVTAHDDLAAVSVYNPLISKGVKISYGKTALPFFTQWKMMGVREYVLGLEPGNCTPDGRDVLRRNGTLRELSPGEIYTTNITLTFSENMEDIQCLSI